MEPYELAGMTDMIKATEDDTLKKTFLKIMDQKTEQDGTLRETLPPQDTMAYFYAYLWSGDEKYRKAMDRIVKDAPFPLEAMPFVTAYDTAFQKKEHYNEIAGYFRNKKTWTGDELIALVGTVEEMSMEIYEYYRELRDMCKAAVREKLSGFTSFEPTGAEQLKTAYCVAKACRLKILPVEKYTESLSGIRQAGNTGIGLMLGAQSILLEKQEVS